jgi:hypothetical protein
MEAAMIVPAQPMKICFIKVPSCADLADCQMTTHALIGQLQSAPFIDNKGYLPPTVPAIEIEK